MNWKSYTSPDKTFTLEYPEGWQVIHQFTGNIDFIAQKDTSSLIFAFSWPVFQFLDECSPLSLMAKEILGKVEWILTYQDGVWFIKNVVIPRLSKLKDFKVISITPIKQTGAPLNHISTGQLDFCYSKEEYPMRARILALTSRWGPDFWMGEVAGYSAEKTEYNNYQETLQHILNTFKVTSSWFNEQIKMQESWSKIKQKTSRETSGIFKDAMNDRQKVFDKINEKWNKLFL